MLNNILVAFGRKKKLKYDKDKFKLYEILNGEPISCLNCKWRLNGGSKKHCVEPLTYYLGGEKKEGETTVKTLFSFCANYERGE
jgi:hypothetical protein